MQKTIRQIKHYTDKRLKAIAEGCLKSEKKMLAAQKLCFDRKIGFDAPIYYFCIHRHIDVYSSRPYTNSKIKIHNNFLWTLCNYYDFNRAHSSEFIIDQFSDKNALMAHYDNNKNKKRLIFKKMTAKNAAKQTKKIDSYTFNELFDSE